MYKFSYYLLNLFLGISVAQLLSAHSTALKLVGLIILVAHSFIIFHIFHDEFLFIMYTFSLCIMGTGDYLGGIAFAPLVVLISYLLFKGKFYIRDKFIGICLLVLLFTNILGYLVKNPSDRMDVFQSVIMFTGFIITFIYVQNFKFIQTQVRYILLIATFLSFILFIIALNQKFVFIDSSLFLLGANPGYPSVSSVKYAFEGRFPSLFGDYELFSEFALLMFILGFSLFMDKNASHYFKLGYSPLFLMIFSFLNTLITGTRSGFILIFAFIFIFFIFRMATLFTNKALLLVSFLIIMIPIIINFGDLFGFDVISNRLKEIDLTRLSVNSLVTGEEINRGYVYSEGYKRIGEENWTLGYGYGVSHSNSLAWLGNLGPLGSNIKDFHSLYLCIPMIYGWIGGITYLVLIIYTIVLLFKSSLKKGNTSSRGILTAFAFMFTFFLINEIKINSLRSYNYHFLIWILLAMALAIGFNSHITDKVTNKTGKG
ncbi:MAG TPA: O-antigen ligase family protein [Desulfobacteraceae bacterium]|nr:O-antigen ligase family protein [Desulfobacteraceae bacterium]